MTIGLNLENSFVGKEEIENIRPLVERSHHLLEEKTGAGSKYLGWMDLPGQISKEELKRINKVAEKIKNNSDIFIVIGIGGSYLGARSCIEALSHSFYNQLPDNKRKTPAIYYAGHHVSGTYLRDLLDLIEGKDISLNVISKSGTTTEPAIAFRILKDYMEKRYGKKESRSRIFITTDGEKGALKSLAEDEGYESFIIPDDIGGRYSIFTPVGLLPIAVAGLDIESLIEGARSGQKEYGQVDMDKNISYQYAAIRNILYGKGKNIEILANYKPQLHFLSEWWKQLFGESEGKDGKGIFPAAVSFTTDLHSMGQLIQDGRRNIFETVINVEEAKKDMLLEADKENLDGLNYLAGKSLDFVNKKAFEGTLKAHVKGGVPNIVINLPRLDEFYFGKLIYFFKKGCALSGYLMGVNPFDQPGVEEYKRNMFQLLGKPGY